jgi:hypothetical protein
MKQDDFTTKMGDKLNFTFDGLDGIRKQGLADLKTFQGVKRNALKKERRRLSEKFGDQHQRVKALDLKIQYSGEMEKDLEVLITEANIQVDTVDKDTWKVHGKVVDENRKGIKNLSVGLYNSKGKWQRELGYGCTDEKGYFSITYSPGNKGIAQETRLFLYVSDKNHKVLYRESEPLFFTPGAIDYRAISLSVAGEEVCTPPEPGHEEPMMPPDQWIVKGWVTDESGKGMKELTVSLFDKDLLFDDYLGTGFTDEQGAFMFVYTTEGFKDLFESKPDIYLKVLDKTGKTIYTSKKAVQCNVGRFEVFNIKIERKSKKG